MDYQYTGVRYTVAKSGIANDHTKARKEEERTGQKENGKSFCRMVGEYRRGEGRERYRDRENKSTAPTCLLLAATLELDASTMY